VEFRWKKETIMIFRSKKLKLSKMDQECPKLNNLQHLDGKKKQLLEKKCPELINLWNLDGKKEAIMIAWNVIFGYPNIRILGYPEHFAIQVSKY
jgi:CO dehydrogenase/acetyl-CoA synthase gamma subunit (corrinoid Fe-S protein)